MRFTSRLGTVLLSAVLSIGGAAAAHAAPVVGGDFAAQGAAAGLTTAQVDTLQAEADGYLEELGGRQVALNRIELDGATIRIALPGEAQPRKLGPGALDANCDGRHADHLHFCAYRGEGFTGTHIDMYACKVYDIPETWVGPGSWDNNQSKNTVARMMNDAGTVIYETPPAHSKDASGSWTPVDRMRNC
ncbi:hypothetical protein [Saccharothrix algeriensis]|uniref:Secreted protein n=1 Tax=Saccharothrix algeriensis TaxID=173560 RepID=A0A8T8HZH5_9PSEU|nr:hypothetical protein [Saccharothrix algeriensis]MBM7809778.1 hypothetical protein [Saccharothrix algeriensis]QTR04053.1 hypothetical protein J7S33_03400 [Saccharothrix algeriensis]